jgi:glycerol-3-phosphate dehydrogenase
MSEFSCETRRTVISELKASAATDGQIFDVLIIGGGVTGAGLALDAAARGLRTALVEKRDFAAGTSSRSTKLIHGGLRYLEHFDFALVREGLKERATLLELAPHLAEPFPFVIPIYHDARRNYDHPLKVRAGLWLYDLLAGRRNIARHRRVSRDEALRLAPQLDGRGLKGALVYYDGRTDDARLVVEVMKTAHARGARIANYVRLVGFIKDDRGMIAGARLRDELTGEEFESRARVVINATGVWMNEVRALDGDAVLSDKKLRPTKGVHLVVSAERLRVAAAWLIPALGERRFYFVVPWEGRVLVGTTDTDYVGGKDGPRAEGPEINEILRAVNAYFPDARLEAADVIATQAGLRPLISSGNAAQSSTAVSRKEELFEGDDGLISLAGGKLTTYRLMAEQGINLAAKRLAERFGVRAGESHTDELVIGGGEIKRGEVESIVVRVAEVERIPADTARHLIHAYGGDFRRVLELSREDERLRAPLVDGLPHLAAEAVYAARYESAMTLADALTRRTRLALLAGEAAVRCAPRAAELMASELEWGEREQERQVVLFKAEYEREYAVPSAPEAIHF